MEIVEVIPGVMFPEAHELPNGSRRPGGKHVSTKSSGNGQKRPRNPLTPVLPGKLRADLIKEAQLVTSENKMIMVLKDGKTRFVKLSEYRSA